MGQTHLALFAALSAGGPHGRREVIRNQNYTKRNEMFYINSQKRDEKRQTPEAVHPSRARW